MKTLAHHIGMIAALGGLLFVSGCTTAARYSTMRSRIIEHKGAGPVADFAVVQSSSDRELSFREMTQLREAVTSFLGGEGLAERQGDYFVRVNFPAAKTGEPDEWVIVKVTIIPSSTYTLLAAYPAIGADDYYPSDYFYDTGFRYWDSSYDYYNPSIYYPGDYRRRFDPPGPRQPGDHKPGDHKPGDIQPGDRDDRPRGTHVRNDGRPDRNDGGPNRDSRPRNTGYTPRPADSDGSRNHAPRGDYAPRSTDSGGSRNYAPRDSSPRSSDFGGSRDHGTRDYSPPSSSSNNSSSSSSSYSPPSSPPVSQSAPEPSHNSSNPKVQEN